MEPLESNAVHNLALTLGGHHRVLAGLTGLKNRELGDTDGIWHKSRMWLCRSLAELTGVDDSCLPLTLGTDFPFLSFLGGLVSVADWIASSEAHFPYASASSELSAYGEQVRRQAREALESLGWCGWSPPEQKPDCTSLFPFEPAPMQQLVEDLVEDISEPALILIEAPTGEGKTEAAFFPHRPLELYLWPAGNIHRYAYTGNG